MQQRANDLAKSLKKQQTETTASSSQCNATKEEFTKEREEQSLLFLDFLN